MLKIKKGGILVQLVWNSVSQEYDELEVKTPYSYLFTECSLDKDITLRDVFTLVNNHRDFFEVVLASWCGEYLDEGLLKSPESPGDIQYLELSWNFVFDPTDEALEGTLQPDFHGMGPYSEGKSPSEIISCAIEFTPCNKLIDLPLQLHPCITYQNITKPRDITYYKEAKFTLGDILNGIFWELSFTGSPADRDRVEEKILKSMKEVEEGTARLIPLDDLMKEVF